MLHRHSIAWATGLISLALLAILFPIAPAVAQFQNGFRYTNLNDQDIDRARAAASSLYAGKRPRLGDQAEWGSPESGAKGIVRIVGTNSDVSCIVLRHRYRETSDGDEKELSIRRCKAADGSWVVNDN